MGLRISKKNRCINKDRETRFKFEINEKNENPLRPIRIGLFGDSRVGKTAICNSLIGMEFQNEYFEANGINKYDKKVRLNDSKEIKLIIWDTSGQERFRSASFKAARFAEVIIIVFDITDKNSFDNIERWLVDIKDNFDEPNIFLFVNKIEEDKEKWKVSIEEIEGVAKKYNLDYFKISAKNSIGIDEGFNCIANKSCNKKIKNIY